MSSSVLEFAQQLETDIRQRCLSPGHKYLTAQESAELLGTSVATANRALRTACRARCRCAAAQQRHVCRSRAARCGGERSANGQHPRAGLCARRKQPATRPDHQWRSGELARRGRCADQLRACRGRRALRRELARTDSQSGRLAGVIATSCPRDVYRYLGENDYPLVVLGSLYSDQPYPSIDADEHAAGKMLTAYLIERGHRRIALFSDSETCAGDNYFRDGVSEALTAANMPHNALIWRAPGTDPAVMRAQLHEVLSLPERPTAIAVKLPKWADDIAVLVKATEDFACPEDVEIVFKGFALGEAGKSAFPHVCPKHSVSPDCRDGRADAGGRPRERCRSRIGLLSFRTRCADRRQSAWWINKQCKPSTSAVPTFAFASIPACSRRSRSRARCRRAT